MNIISKNDQSHCSDGVMQIVSKDLNVNATKDVKAMVNAVPGNSTVSFKFEYLIYLEI